MSTHVMSETVRALTPAQRMTKGYCPECGAAVERAIALAHRDDHWRKRPSEEPGDVEALKRWRMLTDYSKTAEPAATE